jgi:TBC1 domain family member 2A
MKQIDLDVSRTYPEHPYFGEPRGQDCLRQVLRAYAAHEPEIGYCQSMNYVAGVVLLVMERNPQDAFWVLVALLQRTITGTSTLAHKYLYRLC